MHTPKARIVWHVSGAAVCQPKEFRVPFSLFLFAFLGHGRSCWGVPSYFCSYVGAMTYEGTLSFTWVTGDGIVICTLIYQLLIHSTHMGVGWALRECPPGGSAVTPASWQ